MTPSQESLRGHLTRESIIDGLANSLWMDKQKFRPTRRSGFSGTKAYMLYVEILKKRYNNVGRTFCDAIINLLVYGRRGTDPPE